MAVPEKKAIVAHLHPHRDAVPRAEARLEAQAAADAAQAAARHDANPGGRGAEIGDWGLGIGVGRDGGAGSCSLSHACVLTGEHSVKAQCSAYACLEAQIERAIK